MKEIAFLEQLLSIPSPSGAEDEVAAFLVARMAGLGFEAKRDGAGRPLSCQEQATKYLVGVVCL